MSDSLQIIIEYWDSLINQRFPIFVLDQNDHIILCNKAARDTFGIKSGKSFLYFSEVTTNSCKRDLKTNIDDSVKTSSNIEKNKVMKLPLKDNYSLVVYFQTNHAEDTTNIEKKHLHYLRTINNISSKSYKYDNIKQLSEFMVSELYNQEYNFFHIALFLREESFSGDQMILVEIAGESGAKFRQKFKNGYRQSISQGIIGEVIKEEKSIIVTDIDKVEFDHSTPFFQSKSEICIPIFMSNHIIGVINIETKYQQKFNEVDIAFLEIISDIYAANIYRILTTEEISNKNEQLKVYLKDLEQTKKKLESQSEELKKSLALKEETHAYIEKQNELMHYKLKMGAELQKSLLPRKFPQVKNLRFSSKYIPTLQLGGDFFDVVSIDNNHIGVIIADVSGHGVSAAMIAAMFKALFTNYMKNSLHPSEVLTTLNEEFYRMINTGEFISCFYSIINTDTYEFTYTNAGHPFPILYSSSEKLAKELDSAGFFLGVFQNSLYQEKKSHLNSNDKLMFYTDGVIEARGNNSNQFGRKQLANAFLKLASEGIEGKKIIENVYEEINHYSAKKSFEDDLTFLIVERI